MPAINQTQFDIINENYIVPFNHLIRQIMFFNHVDLEVELLYDNFENFHEMKEKIFDILIFLQLMHTPHASCFEQHYSAFTPSHSNGQFA